MAVELRSAAYAVELYRKVKERNSKLIRKYIRQQIKQRTAVLEEALRQLYSIKDWKKASILYPVIDNIRSYKAQIDQLADELDKPFLLFVVGMGKYGKSTLLNALLGQQVADVDVIPKTWKIDVYQKKGDLDKAEVVFKDGSTELMDMAEAKRYLEREEEKRIDSEIKINQRYAAESAQYKTIEAKEELRKSLEKDLLYISPVVEVRWPVAAEGGILNDFRLVDTPGVEQRLLGEVKESLNEYYHKADGVIWLLDATVISAQKARQLLDDLKRSLEAVGGKTDNIIAVLNGIDKVRKNGGQDAVKEVYNAALKIYGDLFSDIVPISAKEAIDGIEKNDKAMIERSGINHLIMAINNTFLAKAGNMQITSKVRGVKSLLTELADMLSRYKSELSQKYEERLKKIDDLHHDYNSQTEQIKMLLKSTLAEYTDNVHNNIEYHAAALFDIKDKKIREQYLIDEIFIMDDLRTAVDGILSDVQNTIKAFYNYHIKNAPFEEFPHLNKIRISDSFNVDLNFSVPNVQDNVDSFENIKVGSTAAMIIGAGFLLGPIGLAIGGIASALGVSRWIAKQFQLPELKNNLNKALANITKEISDKILEYADDQLKSVKEQADNIREGTFAALYGLSGYVGLQSDVIERIKKLKDDPIQYMDVKSIILGGKEIEFK